MEGVRQPKLSTSSSSTTSTAVDDHRPSTTGNQKTSHEPLLSPKLEQGPEQDEREMEECGGDEPEDPPSLNERHSEIKEEARGTEDEANLVHWDEGEVANPRNWSYARKCALTFVTSIVLINVTFASSSPSSAVEVIATDFSTSLEVAELVTTVFLIGYVFGPLIWAPTSELLGRRPIFVVTLSIYILFYLGGGLAQNLQTLLVTRFFQGFFGSAPLTNCGGVMSDIWDPVRLGPAMSVFTGAVFVGPVVGPIVGGFVTTSFLGWRWIFWLTMIFAGACWVLTIFFLPETYAPVLLAKKAKRLRKEGTNANAWAEAERQDWSVRGVLHRTIYRPFQMLFLEPILVLITLYLSVVYGLLYALFEALPIIFEQKRGFSLGLSGLIFIGIGIGSTIGGILNVFFTSHYPRLMKEYRGHPPPENRLRGAMLAGPLIVVGIFWLGWTGEYASVPWYIPALATVLIGTSFVLVFISFLTYLVDTYLMYSASALAANTICRSALAAAFPLFTVQMFQNLGVNWACTLLGCLALLLAPSPFLFAKYGMRIRKRSRFAPCTDLKIIAEIEKESNSNQV